MNAFAPRRRPMATEPLLAITDRCVCVVRGAECISAQPLPDSAVRLAPDELASSIRVVLESAAPRVRRCGLVLPSSWCYVHAFTLPQRRPTRDTLAYAFEEYLPVEVEQLTCTFVRTAPT